MTSQCLIALVLVLTATVACGQLTMGGCDVQSKQAVVAQVKEMMTKMGVEVTRGAPPSIADFENSHVRVYPVSKSFASMSASSARQSICRERQRITANLRRFPAVIFEVDCTGEPPLVNGVSLLCRPVTSRLLVEEVRCESSGSNPGSGVVERKLLRVASGCQALSIDN